MALPFFWGAWVAPGFSNTTVEVTPKLIEGAQVTLSVQVLDSNNIPVDGLKVDNFGVSTVKISDQVELGENLDFEAISANSLKLISPDDNVDSELSYVVILVDMSGSMQALDTQQVRKLEGAIAAIRGFIKSARDSSLNLKIAVIPFGEDPRRAECNYEVNPEEIENSLLLVQDGILDTLVNQLVATQPCAATNLYDPLEEVVAYLGQPDRFVDESGQLSRRSVILLSDGFDNASRSPNASTSEPERFNQLRTVLATSGVTVHTLGYGETLDKLQRRIECRQPVKAGERLVDDLLNFCKDTNGGRIDQWILDEPRLRQIAQVTGGISQFPENADAAAASLATFFKTLQEYELQYVEPTADAAELYNAKVQVISEPRGIDTSSEPIRVRFPNFVFYQLPLFPERVFLLVAAIAGISGVTFSFYRWSKRLKSKAEELLNS